MRARCGERELRNEGFKLTLKLKVMSSFSRSNFETGRFQHQGQLAHRPSTHLLVGGGRLLSHVTSQNLVVPGAAERVSEVGGK